LRVVVLALQDKLAYGTNFQQALDALFGNAESTLATRGESGPVAEPRPSRPPAQAGGGPTDMKTLIAGAAQDLEEYQRLTATGRLGEAGQRLEALKQKLEELSRRQ